MVTKFEDVKPTAGAASNAYEVIVEVQPYGTGAPVDESWKNVPDITEFSPSFEAKTSDTTTYAHKGATSTTKVGSNWSASFNMLKIRDKENEFQDDYLVLKKASDANGRDNLVHIRYYDALGADEAYVGVASVSVAPQATGNEDKGWVTVSLTGDGEFTPITNPLKATGSSEG